MFLDLVRGRGSSGRAAEKTGLGGQSGHFLPARGRIIPPGERGPAPSKGGRERETTQLIDEETIDINARLYL